MFTITFSQTWLCQWWSAGFDRNFWVRLWVDSWNQVCAIGPPFLAWVVSCETVPVPKCLSTVKAHLELHTAIYACVFPNTTTCVTKSKSRVQVTARVGREQRILEKIMLSQFTNCDSYCYFNILFHLTNDVHNLQVSHGSLFYTVLKHL